jgi:hypothetical protein
LYLSQRRRANLKLLMMPRLSEFLNLGEFPRICASITTKSSTIIGVIGITEYALDCLEAVYRSLMVF